jgi:hypothetical protein
MSSDKDAELIRLLREAGETLYGEHWQSEFARAFGLRDSSRVRQQLSGRRPVRPGLLRDAADELRARSVRAAALADEIEELLGEDRSVLNP